MLTSRTAFAPSMLIVLAACGGGSASSPGDAPSGAGAETVPAVSSFVEVDSVQVLQATTAKLLEDAAPAKPNAPVIAGRPGLVRIHARPTDDSGTVTTLVAELRLKTPGKDDVVLADGPKGIVDYVAADLDTTFDFALGEDALRADTTLEVTFRDADASDRPPLVFPAPDAEPFSLGASDAAPVLKVKLVPVRYDADGSKRLPPLDDAMVEAYRRALYKVYPAAKVDVSVRDAMPWWDAVNGNGDGWDQLLEAIAETRARDRVADDVYYVGVFTPAATIGDFCDQGCVLGVAPQAGPNDVDMRVALVTGYGSNGHVNGGTIAQGLAHAMGRAHAPCGGPDAVDRKYPYKGAAIGVPGWDVVSKKLVDPAGDYVDFMSYCQPVWVSDYTYAGLYARMTTVAKQVGGASKTHDVQSYRVKADGSLRLGPKLRVLDGDDGGGGESTSPFVARYTDAAGRTVAASRASFRRYDSIGGGLLLAPEPPPDAVRVTVDGLAARSLDLAR